MVSGPAGVHGVHAQSAVEAEVSQDQGHAQTPPPSMEAVLAQGSPQRHRPVTHITVQVR